MKNHIGQNCLITTQNWFVAPDGKDYKAVWGKLIAVHEAGKELGFIPNRSHANWFIELGNMIIMGCQVMYFVACPNEPNMDDVESWSAKQDGGIKISILSQHQFIKQFNMGITDQSIKRLQPYLRPGINMTELGAQNTYYDPHYGDIAKNVFEAMGISHISLDIIEHQGCVKCDLRELHPFNGSVDVVTNFGTTEHIDGPLYIPFKNIHNACKVGGVMIHENPATGNWPGHGQHYFTMPFYTELAKACGYEVLDLCEEFAMGNITDGKNICTVLKKVNDNEFITEAAFNKIYKNGVFSK